jgi:PII-like signaling protein
MKGEARKCLQILLEDTDTWESEPLYEAIVRLLHKRGVAGATVWSGVMGYGAHGRIHKRGLFGVADEKPILITAIDTEEAIRGVLPELLQIVKEGLVLLQDAEVFAMRSEGEPDRQ